ncbi:MAG: murein biosynthesis integral membrane protein MurJ [Myxococcota bacterium]
MTSRLAWAQAGAQRLLSSTNRRVAWATLIVGTLSLVAKLAVAGKDLLVANRFGTQDALDAFLVAYTVPLFASSVVCGSFNSALIPTLVETRERDGVAAAQRLLSTVMVFTLGLLLLVSVALLAAAPVLLPLLGGNFGEGKLKLTFSLFLLMSPILVLSGASTLGGAVLNAENRFALAAIAPLASPVLTGIALVVAPPAFAIHAMAVATSLGSVAEAAIVGIGVSRVGFSLIPRWHAWGPAARHVLRQYVPMVAGALVLSSSGLIGQAFAGSLGQGSVSALNYGNKLVSFVAGIAALSLGTAVLPQFSSLVARRDARGLRHTLSTYTGLVLLSIVPLTLVLVLASTPIVRLVFERGAFTASDTLAVARVQSCFVLQLPFYILGTLFVRLISAFGGNAILLRIAIATLALYIALGFWLTRAMGVAGIGLATSAIYMVSAPWAGWTCWRLLRDMERSPRVAGGDSGN